MAACLSAKLKVLAPLIFSRRASGELAKDAMKLRIAAEACFESSFEKSLCVTDPALRIVLLKKALHALPIAKVDDGEACLLLEESAETRGAKPGAMGQIVEVVRCGVVQDQMRGALDGWMNIAGRDLARPLKALPGMQQSVGKPCVEQAGFSSGIGEIAEDLFEVGDVLLSETTAGVDGQRFLQKWT